MNTLVEKALPLTLLLAIAGHRRALEPDLNPWRRRFHALGIALADAVRGSSPAAG